MKRDSSNVLLFLIAQATMHTQLYTQYFKDFDEGKPLAESSLFVGSRRFPLKIHFAEDLKELEGLPPRKGKTDLPTLFQKINAFLPVVV